MVVNSGLEVTAETHVHFDSMLPEYRSNRRKQCNKSKIWWNLILLSHFHIWNVTFGPKATFTCQYYTVQDYTAFTTFWFLTNQFDMKWSVYQYLMLQDFRRGSYSRTSCHRPNNNVRTNQISFMENMDVLGTLRHMIILLHWVVAFFLLHFLLLEHCSTLT